MAVHAERAIQSFESGGTPVEMLVVGCPLNVADGFANALRNQGQAAHLKTADDLASLDEQLSGEICDLVVVNADSASVPVTQVVAKVRALSPRASLLLVGTDRKTMKPWRSTTHCRISSISTTRTMLPWRYAGSTRAICGSRNWRA